MPVLRGRVLGVGSQDCGGTTEPPNGVLGGPRLPRPSTPISLTVPQDIPFGLSPHSLSGPPGKLGPFPPTPISPASLHPDTDVPSGELPWHPWGLSSLLLTLWTPQCMGTAAGWGRAAAGSPPGTGISPEAPRGVRSFSHQLWLPFSLLLWHIWSVPSCSCPSYLVLSHLAAGQGAPTRASTSFRSGSHEGRREGVLQSAPSLLHHPDCYLTRLPGD